MALSSGRGIAYVRVSTAEQAESGLGLEAQVAIIRVLAQRLNVELVATFDDAVSGGVPIEQRPGLLAAIDALQSPELSALLRMEAVAQTGGTRASL